ncbi:DUF3095 domain-containing protein [Leptolyngbya sp. FACHB-36]|uniref:DUF3095 domain-containing protein n=1 Tax=Leptolyngbya sp. FACHB-36 TaxID=2692808 RepID=UPI001680EB8D|nr:DUF3095 domain-containing protein [Leptolyngbya sp. FACHB-36]MBD2021897.1 DUF3095 domain-containing protein [Leptolyngbya sp. FACHB-36]
MSTDDFYKALPTLTKFLDLANPDHYVDAPDDWYILIADIVKSTQAISRGQYKEVNLLGASSLIAVLNAVKPLEIPFVFGGDGMSLLVPPAYLYVARQALLGVRHLAQTTFGMELRIGAVPVAIVQANCSLKVAKFRVTPSYCQASFTGGGITYATDLIKADAAYRLDVDRPSVEANLTGLECRWQDIPSRYGQTLTLIVAAPPSSQQSNDHVYRDVLEKIQHIYGDAKNYHPVITSALKLSFNPIKLRAETNARSLSTRFWSRIKYLIQILIGNFLGAVFMKLQLKIGEVNWGRYKSDVCAASDYQKIDDVLRMVISSKPAQTEQLTQYLDQRFRAGQLAYGIHVSDRALMTCLILDRRNQHFHLIDGADGGYALAAKALKSQLHRKAQNWKAYAKLASIAQQHQKPSQNL